MKRPMLLVITIAVVQAALVLIAIWPQPAAWDPIEPYARQQVLNTGGPIPHDEVVVVAGEKCYSEAVTIDGVVAWATEDPPGTHIVTGFGQADRVEGCVKFCDGCAVAAFRNTIPQAVIDADSALREQGVDPVWYITGTETPKQGDRVGVARTWRTESFRLSEPAES